MSLVPATASWADDAIEEACRLAEEWYRALPAFEPRVNLVSVVGRKYPAILSEQDCVINFARFLNEAGVPWDALHHEVSVSRWMFDKPHPAATAVTGSTKWRVDLALLKTEDFLAAQLPAVEPGFQFDAFLEFAYLSDYWKVPGARVFGGDPERGREKVEKDVEKMVATWLAVPAESATSSSSRSATGSSQRRSPQTRKRVKAAECGSFAASRRPLSAQRSLGPTP